MSVSNSAKNAMTDSDLEKWQCDHCTYLNFPVSLRCTLCRRPKPIRRIEDAAKSTISNRHFPDCNKIDTDRWICPRCTYINWQRSRKCIQCTLQKSIRSGQYADFHSNTGRSDGESSESCDKLSISSDLSLNDVNNFQQNTPGTSRVHLDSQLVTRQLQKWTCSGCTYENWPKTNKCIMCFTQRLGQPPAFQKNANRTNSLKNGSGNQILLEDESRDGEGAGRKSPKSSGSSSENLAAAAPIIDEMDVLDRHLRRLRHQKGRFGDFLWLKAAQSLVLDQGGVDAVEAYLLAEGDPHRKLTTAELFCTLAQQLVQSRLLGRALQASVFEPYQSLIHLSLLYGRDDAAALLLSRTTANAIAPSRVKRAPCHVSPDGAADIRRAMAAGLRQRKGELPCFFFNDTPTFALPAAIFQLTPPSIQQVLFDEVLDRAVQKELEEECAIINWSLEVTDRLSSRLYALWNRTSGDCLLDSVLQATWGIFDSENSLRQALADSLADACQSFYPRWREYESLLAKAMNYSPDECQFVKEWEYILKLAGKPGAALEQAHVFALAHIVRRPIIVYGVRIVKSYSGEQLDFARFEGVYLPLLWEPSFCSRSPICLGYTRGHFVALVPLEPIGLPSTTTGAKCVHLPLQDADGKLLPVHFVGRHELGHEPQMLRTWLDATVTDGGVWCAKMRLAQQHGEGHTMIEDWLDYYRLQGQHLALQQQQQHHYQQHRRFIRPPSPNPPSLSPTNEHFISPASTTNNPLETLHESPKTSSNNDINNSGENARNLSLICSANLNTTIETNLPEVSSSSDESDNEDDQSIV